VWGVKERLFERLLPALSEHRLAQLLEAASVCDGVCKGLRHPAWPDEAWEALRHLALLMLQSSAAPAPRGRTSPGLALHA
jgi:DNA polymerase III subunit delta